MNFKEASEALDSMAKGEYRTITYTISTSSDRGSGEAKQECSVYIHNREIHTAKNWKLALESMSDEINKQEIKIEEIKEIS